MGFRAWRERRKEKKEKKKRLGNLTEEEIKKLNVSEKEAYLEVAKKQVTFRGKINAYKDFPVPNSENYEIDIDKVIEDKVIEDSDKEPKEPEEELEEPEEFEPPVMISENNDNKLEEVNNYEAVKTARPLRVL